MKKILIYGAGGFGREVQWLIERINKHTPMWKIEGYLDDGVEKGTDINGYPVLGGMDALKDFTEDTNIVCAVANSIVRHKIVDKITETGRYSFPNLIDPSVCLSERIEWGKGIVVFSGNTISVNVTVGDFVFVDWNCTIGHDTVLDSFVTLYPSVNVSGAVKIGAESEIGVGSQIIQGKTIGARVRVGAGAVVVKDLLDSCTAVGIPARPIKCGEK